MGYLTNLFAAQHAGTDDDGSGHPDGQASKDELDASGNNPFGTHADGEGGADVPPGGDAPQAVEQKPRGRRRAAAQVE